MQKKVKTRMLHPFFIIKGAGNSGPGPGACSSPATGRGGKAGVPTGGASFQVRLPRSKASGPSGAASNATAKSARRRILIVEDDKEVLEVLKDMVELTGHEVVAAHDSTEAMALIDREDFDLVLTDLGMPAVTGWDIARRIKEKNRLVPVVMITGWGTQYEDVDLAERGVDLVVSKPVGFEQLKSVIQSLL